MSLSIAVQGFVYLMQGWRAVVARDSDRVSAFSNVLNALTGGDIDQRFCARVGRNAVFARRSVDAWRLIEKTCNFFFRNIERDHCWESYKRDLYRRLNK